MRWFEELLALVEVEGVNIAQAQVYPERLQQCMHIGSSLPHATSSTTHASNKPKATFITHQDTPGGRPNNDQSDICQIQILPTFEEISSVRAEYLPLNGPAQWHVAGIDGVLDKDFRLLREDIVGQLRDAVHQLIEISRPYRSGASQLRRNHYNGARIA
jgi:hypothetical protein